MLCAACRLQFISPYNGNKVNGVRGSSVNFTWAFSGGGVDQVQWGSQKDGVLVFERILVTVDKFATVTTTTDSPYNGRVNGVWDGRSPGQATFTLSSIQKADEKSYICNLSPKRFGALPVFDTVQLLVVGK